MTALTRVGILAGAATLALLGTQASAATQAAAPPAAAAQPAGDVIARAQSAGPAAIASHATIDSISKDGATTVLRKGTNGWTCADTLDHGPMCYDSGASKWVDAMIHKQAPPAAGVGLIYMLDDGSSHSGAPAANAAAPAMGMGSHVMIVGSKDLLAAYAGTTDKGGTMPYVMGAGTPYAHLMVPVGH